MQTTIVKHEVVNLFEHCPPEDVARAACTCGELVEAGDKIAAQFAFLRHVLDESAR